MQLEGRDRKSQGGWEGKRVQLKTYTFSLPSIFLSLFTLTSNEENVSGNMLRIF